MPIQPLPSITLYCRENSSDKVYMASIESEGNGYTVQFAYGRRGSTLNTGRKTTSPVPLEQARDIYDKLVRSKTAKGYTTGPDGTPYTDATRNVTDIRPQLLNPTEDPGALLQDDAYCLQEKHDGKRLLLRKRGCVITGINRRGIECGIPAPIHEAAASLPGDFLMDGEAVGETLHAFDLLEDGGRDIRGERYSHRLSTLLELIAAVPGAIRHVHTELGRELKRIAFEKLRRANAEGVVFKRLDAPCTPGRPASGGTQFKYKFVETASVIIQAVNAKRSVAIAVWGKNATLVACGNVTIPADQPIPQVGDMAEVRYLYAMPGSGSLYQPVYLGTRDDIMAAECSRDQLKFRREEEAA